MNRQVNTFWADRIRSRATLYSSLQYLAAGDYYPGKTHWVLQHTGITRDIPCVGIKLKLLTGTYILQSNRAAFNQNQVDPTCLMCQQEPETVDHFLVGCSALEDKRCMIMDSIIRSLADFTELPMTADQLVQIILDCSKVIDRSSRKRIEQPVRDFEKLTRRLCYTLHTERYKRLNLLPRRLSKNRGKCGRRTQKHE